MATRIVYNYAAMAAAVRNINAAANDYATAATTLKTALTTSTNDWEGMSKDKFMTLVDSVTKYLSNDVPEIVRGIAKLVENSSNVMAQADSDIAGHIPDSI